MNLVSIIIPTYNVGSKLWKCVESFVKQTYQWKEIIVIDDGSDENNSYIYKEIKKKYQEIYIYHQKNAGVSSARNLGIRMANGKYLFFADADDYAEAGMLEKMIKIIEEYNAHLVIMGYYFDIPIIKDDIIKWMNIEQKAFNRFLADKDDIKSEIVKLWDMSLMYNVWNKLFVKEIIDKYKITYLVGKAFNEDRDFVRNYISNCSRVVVKDESFYHYVREEENTATSVYRANMLNIRKEEYWQLQSFFIKIGVWNNMTREYISREHFERIVGCVENLFYNNKYKKKEILKEIKRILQDKDTKSSISYVKPKSKKMKVMHFIYRINSSILIYYMTYIIFYIHGKHPQIFYKLRQER